MRLTENKLRNIIREEVRQIKGKVTDYDSFSYLRNLIKEEVNRIIKEFEDSEKRITIDYDELPVGENQDWLIAKIENYLPALNSDYTIENDKEERNLYIYLSRDVADWKIKQYFIDKLERELYNIKRAYSIGTTTPENRFENFNENIKNALKNNSEVEYESSRNRNKGKVFRFKVDDYEFELYTYEYPSPYVEIFDPTSKHHPLTDDESEIFSSIELGEEDANRIVNKMVYYLRGYLEDEAIDRLRKNNRLN